MRQASRWFWRYGPLKIRLEIWVRAYIFYVGSVLEIHVGFAELQKVVVPSILDRKPPPLCSPLPNSSPKYMKPPNLTEKRNQGLWIHLSLFWRKVGKSKKKDTTFASNSVKNDRFWTGIVGIGAFWCVDDEFTICLAIRELWDEMTI